MELTVFERPLGPGWVYPCTVTDIWDQLGRLPPADVSGLAVVGLVPSTRKGCSANARYAPGLRPWILLYSYPDTLSIKLPPHISVARAELGWRLEMEFGMRLEVVGARLFCHWQPDDLRRFVLQYVLVHEIGHHVQYKARQARKLKPLTNREAKERFAEDYAIRYIRAQGGIDYSR
jgi:hypothetical protein